MSQTWKGQTYSCVSSDLKFFLFKTSWIGSGLLQSLFSCPRIVPDLRRGPKGPPSRRGVAVWAVAYGALWEGCAGPGHGDRRQRSAVNKHWFLLLFLLFLSSPDILLLILEKEEGRERNTNVPEKHPLAASCMYPDWGSYLQPRYVPWPGIKPTTFWCTGWCSNQLSHLARAINTDF